MNHQTNVVESLSTFELNEIIGGEGESVDERQNIMMRLQYEMQAYSEYSDSPGTVIGPSQTNVLGCPLYPSISLRLPLQAIADEPF
jgi:hypothetical protein